MDSWLTSGGTTCGCALPSYGATNALYPSHCPPGQKFSIGLCPFVRGPRVASYREPASFMIVLLCPADPRLLLPSLGSLAISREAEEELPPPLPCGSASAVLLENGTQGCSAHMDENG